MMFALIGELLFFSAFEPQTFVPVLVPGWQATRATGVPDLGGELMPVLLCCPGLGRFGHNESR